MASFDRDSLWTDKDKEALDEWRGKKEAQ